MRNLKKMVAVMLAAVCVFALTACGNDNAKIAGEYTAYCDVSEMMSKEVGADVQFKMELNWTFEKNGDMKITYTESNIDNMIEKIYDLSLEVAYEQLEQQGMSKADVDALFEAQYGMTTREYLIAGMENEVENMRNEFKSQLKDMADLGTKYELKGDKLYIADPGQKFTEDSCLTVVVEDGKITCSNPGVIPEFKGVMSSIVWEKNN